MAVESPLARFVDRHTMVYDRAYPHVIELVWEAVSTGEHLDVWMLPESRVERRLGGACAFGWGGSADDPAASRGTVTIYDPPTAIQYTFDDGSFMRFDVVAEVAATALSFTLHFLPPADNKVEEYHGGDLPAGLDTAWRPGFLAGYHDMLDQLAPFLGGTWTAVEQAALIEKALQGEFDVEHEALTVAYREYVAAECPPS
jgi:uncharacterized protein YndB with AHSA1/START domain